MYLVNDGWLGWRLERGERMPGWVGRCIASAFVLVIKYSYLKEKFS